LVAGVGLAVLATTAAGCVGQDQTKVGGGPANSPSAAPAHLRPTGSPAPPDSQRPNVVTIVTDDMRTDDLRWMPHVRQLFGQEGLQFQNSFASYPLCAPARSSLLTGQYAHNTDVLGVDPPQNFAAFDDRATLGTAMNQAGYNTVFLGKYMNGYGLQKSEVTGKNSFRYVPPGWTDWWGAPGRPKDSGLKSGGTYNYYHVLFNHNGKIDDSHQGRYQTVVEGNIARRMVRKYHRSAKPFLLYFAPIAPHFGAPREKGDPGGIHWPQTSSREPFKTPARPARVRGRFDSQITRASGLPLDGSESQPDVNGLPRPMRWLPPIADNEKRAMLSVTRQRAEALAVLDTQIGKLVTTLKKTGEYDDTVLMFTSDNGYFLGEHRMRQGKIWTQEPSLRVPFLVTGHGIPQGLRYDPISSEDIPATILELGGAKPPHPPDGVSLVPSFTADRGWRVPVLLENQVYAAEFNTLRDESSAGFDKTLTGTGLRTSRWKYVRYIDGDVELYDLDRDPNELHNLHGVKKAAGIEGELDRVWHRYHDCQAAACRAPLPRSLQTGPEQLASRTRAQERIVEARYGVPAL
jgi:arylsulfatase A-like enzyme